MAYRIFYHPEVKNDISKFPRNIKDRIQRAIEERLLVDPVHYGLCLKRSLQGFRKLRVGDYRVIFKIDGENIKVLMIAHRKDVYRFQPRKD